MTTAAPETTQARRQAISVGLATGAYGVSFGALSVAALSLIHISEPTRRS